MSGPIALKLLVIDDNRQNLDLITTALEQEGVEILTLRLASTYSARPTTDCSPRSGNAENQRNGVAGTYRGGGSGTDVILITAHYSAESAVEAIQKVPATI